MGSMPQDPQLPGVRALPRQAHDTMPPRRFRKTVALGIGLAVLIGAPIGALLVDHEGPWTGLLWDSLVRLPFVLVCFGFVVLTVRAARDRKWKKVLQGCLVLAFFGTITSVASLQFARQLRGLIHFRRMQGPVRSVTVGCQTTEDVTLVAKILSDLRKAEWYSPDSHGWAPYTALTLKFADGHVESYALTEVLAEDRLVLHPAEGDSGLLAVPKLTISLGRAGLLSVSSHPRYDKKGFYEAIVPSSVCKEPREANEGKAGRE